MKTVLARKTQGQASRRLLKPRIYTVTSSSDTHIAATSISVNSYEDAVITSKSGRKGVRETTKRHGVPLSRRLLDDRGLQLSAGGAWDAVEDLEADLLAGTIVPLDVAPGLGLRTSDVGPVPWDHPDLEPARCQLGHLDLVETCLLYTSPSPRDLSTSRMPSSA